MGFGSQSRSFTWLEDTSPSLLEEKPFLLELFLKTSAPASKSDRQCCFQQLASLFAPHTYREHLGKLGAQPAVSIEYVGMVPKYKHGWNPEQGKRGDGCGPQGIVSVVWK